MPASYNLSDLVDLCDIYGNNAGELLIDYDNHAYLFHDDGVWLRLTEEFWKLTPDERKASIGINPGKLTCSDGEVWGKRTDTGEAAPILPFPFTAAQLLELDERTGGTFSEHIYCGNETDERISEIARLNPKAAELARALIYGELPPQEAATPAPVVADSASNAPSMPMKKIALTAELLFEWPTIEADMREASRNGLKDAAHTGKHGEWDKDKARAWALSKGKIKQKPTASVWPGAITKHHI